jgi:hypothetical protein
LRGATARVDRDDKHPYCIEAIHDLGKHSKAFVAERWQPHKPLKICIDADLIATGVLTPSEAPWRAARSDWSKRNSPVC